MHRTPIVTFIAGWAAAIAFSYASTGCGNANDTAPSSDDAGNAAGGASVAADTSSSGSMVGSGQTTTGPSGSGVAGASSQTTSGTSGSGTGGSSGTGEGGTGVGSGTGGGAGASPNADGGNVIADDAAIDAKPTIRVVGPGETTLTILGAQGSTCVSCAMTNGCLDVAQLGGACEDVAGTAPVACEPVFGTSSPVTETKVCLATLKMILSSHCSADLQQEPCYCGLSDRTMCLAGEEPPTGPGVDLYTCDLGSGGVSTIVSDFGTQTRGAGQANEIVDCIGALGCDCNL